MCDNSTVTITHNVEHTTSTKIIRTLPTCPKSPTSFFVADAVKQSLLFAQSSQCLDCQLSTIYVGFASQVSSGGDKITRRLERHQPGVNSTCSVISFTRSPTSDGLNSTLTGSLDERRRQGNPC